ncbi:hypothetical protein TRFO_06023 [Tritrichomonas foetus]|uniref:Acyltransferase family protein n=1 Tax=Tritrichomonas foetus TaxID=1144522 RepID=A0A1J4K5P2_9EUKA|nr:hypothetical protein TRFO_06023 [Tritrichomonas foetus]|eukprot:OHT05044.1 hypothetical protein TRFO_06023 [Tritrichomonas foetus]
MEKFGSFSDQASGVRPFIPIENKMSSGKCTLVYVLGLLKFALAIPSLVTMWINPLLFQFLPIWFIRNFIIRFNHLLHGGFNMILTGNYYTPAVPTPLIKKIIEPQKWKRPNYGDVVFAPLNSFKDLIWMAFTMSPAFLIPIGEDLAVQYTLFPLILKLLFNKDLRNGQFKVKISDFIKQAKDKKKYPVVIFAECAPTNGTGLLKFAKIDCPIPEDTNIQIIGFKRQFEGVSPNRASGSLFKYILQTYGALHEKATALVALEKDVPRHEGRITPEFVEKVREVTGKLLHLPLLELDADTYVEYIRAYREKGKGKVKTQ